MAKLSGRIGAYRVDVKLVPDLEDAYGLHEKSLDGGRRILISDVHTQNPIDFMDTLVHESVHAVANVYGIEDPEHLCHTMAAGLTQFWTSLGLVRPEEWQLHLKKGKRRATKNQRRKVRPGRR